MSAVMEIWNGTDSVPGNLTGASVTVGVFDGVHRGHQQLIATTVRRAREHGVPAVMVTFAPHPVALFRPGAAPAMLGTLDQRAATAARYGIDAMLVIDFDHDVAAWSPADYFRRILVDLLHARAVTIGENFFFGHRAAGTCRTMQELGDRHGVDVTVHGLLGDELDGIPHTVCSTWIRGRIAAGDLRAAERALGHPFEIQGAVHDGTILSVPAHQALPPAGDYPGLLRSAASDPAGTHARPVQVRITPAASDGDRPRQVDVVLPGGDDLSGRIVAVSLSGR